MKIRIPEQEKAKMMEVQAVGKVLSDKQVHQDAISLSLGRVWFPIKGTDCKEVGENMSLFTFNQD